MSGVFSKAVNWAGEHPVVIAVAVFGIGALILLRSSGGSSSGGGTNMSTFFAAQTAQSAQNAQLAATKDQDTAAVALGQIQAGVATHASDNALTLGLAANDTAQQGQKQQFFLATGQQQIEAQAMPYLLQKIGTGGPGDATDTSTLAAEQIWHDFIAGGTGYSAAH